MPLFFHSPRQSTPPGKGSTHPCRLWHLFNSNSARLLRHVFSPRHPSLINSLSDLLPRRHSLLSHSPPSSTRSASPVSPTTAITTSCLHKQLSAGLHCFFLRCVQRAAASPTAGAQREEHRQHIHYICAPHGVCVYAEPACEGGRGGAACLVTASHWGAVGANKISAARKSKQRGHKKGPADTL